MDNQDKSTHHKLSSASELKGKKAGGKGGWKMWQSLLAMVLVLGLAVGAYYLSDKVKPQAELVPEATLAPSTIVKIVERDKATVDKVSVQVKGEAAYTILYNAGREGAEGLPTYAVEGVEDFSLNESLAGSMIGYCANFSASKEVATGVTDLAQYGLQSPAIKVGMYYRDGSSEEWHFGDKVPTSSAYYLMKKGTGTVFMVYSSPYMAFDKALKELHTAQMPWTVQDYTTIQNVLIEQKGKETVELGYTDQAGISISALKLKQPFVYDAHSERADALFQAVAAFAITGYEGKLSALSQSVDTGLGEEPRARVQFSDKDGQTISFDVGNFRDADSVYVQIDDSDAVYLASADSVAFLDNAKASYLVDQFSNLVFINRVDGLTIKTQADEYVLRIHREPVLDENGEPMLGANNLPKSEDTYFFDDEETDEELFKDLYQVIIGTLVSKISEDRNLQGEVVASVTYALNIEPHTFTVEYLTYDREYYAVRRDGMTLFLIKKDKVDFMLAEMASYRAGTFEPRD